MTIYGRYWKTTATVLMAAFVVVAILWQMAVVGAAFAAVAVVAAGIASIGSASPRMCIRYGLLAGLVASAFIGAVVAIGGWSLLLMALLITTSPRILSSIGDRLGKGGFAEELSSVPDRSTGIRTMSTSDLCNAWSRSSAALETAPTPAARAHLALLRQEYLDELEARDTQGFRAWLAGGAENGSDPASFLRQD